ncbi:MAG: DnaD domain protein [Erysipelotrichia bacterium]|nr:DnaD domain protein [Erysipelotrichia bacterium]NCC54286.1 DnaD domain protein [Erysipelotrichia bacterium]
MKLYNAPFFNRRNWIMEHMDQLELNVQEILLILCIDYMNEFDQIVDVNALSKKMKIEGQEVDCLLSALINKGYLHMESNNRKMIYNIDRIFMQKENAQPCASNEFKNLFSLYEKEFKRPLSQRESEMLSEWIELYELKLIEYALREAIIYDTVNFAYINKILMNWKEKHFTAKMYEERDI